MAKGTKTGGRKPGTRNKAPSKKLILQTAEEIAAQHKLDPFEVLMMVASGDWEGLGYDSETETCYTAQGIEFERKNITLADRVAAAREANKYLRSAKPVQLETPPDGEGFVVKILDYTSKKVEK